MMTMRGTLRLALLFVLVFGAVVAVGRLAERRVGSVEGPVGPEEPLLVPDVGGEPTWRVDGAGDPSYNGGYVKAGEHDGKPWFAGGSPTRFLYWHEAGGEWQLGAELGALMNAYGGESLTDLWHQGAAMGALPAPTVSEVGGTMLASSAGDATYDGTYIEAGVHNGKPYYTYGSPLRYLHWDIGAAEWWLGTALGIDDYHGTGAVLPANPWIVGMGAGPAPTVSAAGGWLVEGTGDPSYDGTYTEAGVFGGKVYYTKAAPVRFLFWHEILSVWALSDVLDGMIPPAYSGMGADLPANPWMCEGGPPTPPVVSAVGGASVPRPGKAALYNPITSALVGATEEVEAEPDTE